MQISTLQQTASPQAPLAQNRAKNFHLSDHLANDEKIVATPAPGAEFHIPDPIADGLGQITPTPESQNKGLGLLEKLRHITGASIAASTTLTGNAGKGGNWKLEVTLGEIASSLVFAHHQQLTYQGVLGAGHLDTSFNGTGKVTTNIVSGDDQGSAMTIDSNGKILVAGSAFSGTDNDFALARYNSNGTLDTSFDTDGKVTTGILSSSDVGNAMTIDSSGKILVCLQ